MKVVLIYPQPIPLITFHDAESVTGLGLLYLADSIKDHHDVTILGGTNNPKSSEELIELISREEPDVLGISTIFSTLMISGKEIAREIKRRFPNIIIIFGGNHATFTAHQLAAEEYADIVVMGEGEVTFKELINRLSENRPIDEINGIVFRKDGEIRRTPPRPSIENIDIIPFPDWKLLTDKMPVNLGICSSRGCPHSCIYCSTTSFWGRRWRSRSARNIIDEIHYVLDSFNPEDRTLKISFADDNFTVDRKRVKEFCRLLKEEKLDSHIEWGVSSRIELLNEDLLATMSDAGCTNIFMGTESGSARVLKAMQRNYDADTVMEKVELCIEYGILPTCSFMVGNPFEDHDDVADTFDLLKKIKTHKLQIHIFTPLIGTDVFKDPKKYGVELLNKDGSNHASTRLEGRASLNTAYLSAEEINKYYNKGLGLLLRRNREGKRLKALADRNRERRRKLTKMEETV